MSPDSETTSRRGTAAWHAGLLLAGAAGTYLLVTMGALVCATGSRLGCPDWPLCYGELVPPMRIDSVIEYSHRGLAVLTLSLTVAAAVAGWRLTPRALWVSVPPVAALPLFLAVAIFGAMAVLHGLPPWLAAIDVGCALLALALMTTGAVTGHASRREAAPRGRLAAPGPTASLAAAALVATFVLLVSGVLVTVRGSMTGCLGWPLPGTGPFSADVGGWAALARRALGLLAALLTLALSALAWRQRRSEPALVPPATTAAALVVLEAVLGVGLALTGFPLLLRVGYVASAAGVWVALTVATVLAALRPSVSQRAESGTRPSFAA